MGDENPLGGCLRKGLVLVVIFGLFSCVLTGSIGWMTTRLYKEADPEGYNQAVAETLGINSTPVAETVSVTKTTTGTLAPGPTQEKTDLAKKTNYSVELLDRAAMVADWMDKKFGSGAGDWTIYATLTTGESANCSNAGTTPVLSQYRTHAILSKNLDKQITALKAFLAVWKKYDIRKTNPIAAAHLSADYDPEKVLGSAVGGAMGCSQFIASTAFLHFDEIEDPKDLWDPLTSMKMMALELHRIGWNAKDGVAQKAATLLKWNNEPSWVQSIAQTASSLLTYKNLPNQTLAVTEAVPAVIADSEEDGKDWKLTVLDWLGLGLTVEASEIKGTSPVSTTVQTQTAPAKVEVVADRLKVGDWKLPLAGKPYFTSGAAEHRSRGSTIGWDLAFVNGTGIPVYAAKAGTVENADCGDGSKTANFGYGCMVVIRHDEHTKTRYGHLNGIAGLKVEPGDIVTQETLIGLMGSTGNSTGAHLHFEIIIDGVAQDPVNYFGTSQSLGLR